MNPWLFFYAAVLLSIERICYLWIWRKPAAFRYWCGHPALDWMGEPVDALALLFSGFKALQLAVFFVWCYFFSGGSLWPLDAGIEAIVTGGAFIAVGQALNMSVFYRLGKVGVFYGNKFGYRVSWQNGFPFSFLKHPQYAGTLLSIWGFFLVMRFPNADWYWLPLLETIYYGLAAYYER